MEEKKSFLMWIKEHKKQLIIAGISVASIVAIVIAFKKRESTMRMWESLRPSIAKQPLKTTEGKSMLSITSAPHYVPVKEVIPATEITVIKMPDIQQSPFDVNKHLRNLHEGWEASETKIATAAEHGYILKPGQTWVDSFTKGGIAA